jgi:hypothetical protein
VVSVVTDGRWQLMLFQLDAGPSDFVRLVGPRDGSNRYDASFISDDSIITVSTRGGIANLEKLHVATGGTSVVTSVTGAAVATGVSTRRIDRSGFSRSIRAGTTCAASKPPRRQLDRSHNSTRGSFPAVPPAAARRRTFQRTPYRHRSRSVLDHGLFRWIPQPFADADGASVGLGLVSADLIGRSEILVVGAAGDAAQSRGVAAEFTWRGWRNRASRSWFRCRAAAERESVARSAGWGLGRQDGRG